MLLVNLQLTGFSSRPQALSCVGSSERKQWATLKFSRILNRSVERLQVRNTYDPSLEKELTLTLASAALKKHLSLRESCGFQTLFQTLPWKHHSEQYSISEVHFADCGTQVFVHQRFQEEWNSFLPSSLPTAFSSRVAPH
jgi:hypothetical protein